MSNDTNSSVDPPQLVAALRILDRFAEEDRASIEKAIREQYDADQEDAQEEAARIAEEEATRQQQEEEAAAAEAELQAQAFKEQEAHLAAARSLVDLVKASESATDSRDKGKKVTQDDDLANELDLLVAMPSQKVRDKIKANDYIDLWHLTNEGMAVATRSKLTGDTTFELGADGTFKLKDSVAGFRPDQDLSMSAWVFALSNYVRVMRAEGVADNIVQSMIRLNHTLTNHPDFDRHGQAIRLWHQYQRRQWVLSGHLRADGARFNLGKPNPQHFIELRMRVMEERAERRLGADRFHASGSSQAGFGTGKGVKRSAPDDFPGPPGGSRTKT
ncbi:hypothetical protein OC844_006365, partial [Tilletia horrida]